MKLIIYDRSDLSGRARPHKPTLRIYKEYVTLYPELCRLIDLSAGEGVKFAQDANNPTDWYICKDNEEGIRAREDNKTKSLRVILRAFTKTMPEHWYRQDISVGSEFIVVDGYHWYPLITAPLNALVNIETKLSNDKPAKDELFNPDSARKQY